MDLVRIRSAARVCAERFRRFVTGAAGRWPVVLSLLVTAVHLLNGPGLAPCRWEELAVAWGLRLPHEALSGLWRLLLLGLDAVLPPDVLVILLWLAGAIAAGLLVFVCDRLFDWILPSVLRTRLLSAPDGLFWKRLLTGGGALLFVCCDAVWDCCRTPGAGLGQICGMLLTLFLLIWLLRRRRCYGIPFVTFLLGLLTGDGLFAAFAFWGVFAYLNLLGRDKVGKVTSELTNPIVLRTVTALVVCGYLLGLGAALVTNVWVYRHLGGVLRTGTAIGDVLHAVIGDELVSAAAVWSAGSFFFVLLILLLPMVIVRFAIFYLWPRKGESPAWFLVPVSIGSVVTFSQLTGFGPLNYWVPVFRQSGAFAVAVWTFVGLMVVIWGFACLVTRSRTLEDVRWQHGIVRFVGLAVAVMYLSVTPGWIRLQEGRIRGFVDDYCAEVAEECAADEHLVTDGSLDAGVELAAWRKGRRLMAVSTVSGSEPYEVKTRQRGVTNGEDRVALASGAADALREWLEIRTNQLTTVAAQTGFDRRRAFGETVQPRYSGLVVHFGGVDGRSDQEGRDRVRALGRRIVEFRRQGSVLSQRMDPTLRHAFSCVQWRVAQACRQRMGNPEAVADERTADGTLADELDRLNPELGAIRLRYGWLAEHRGAVILPREGLKMALAKKDFTQAGYYAEQVLKSAPDDAEAHFALGMSHYLNRQYARAIEQLLRVLEIKGENPGVLNNLAMAYLRLGRWMEAVAAAERAVRAPGADIAIRKSADYISRQAREQMKGGGK